MQKIMNKLEPLLPDPPAGLGYLITVGKHGQGDVLCLKIGLGPAESLDTNATLFDRMYFTMGIPYALVPVLMDWEDKELLMDSYHIRDTYTGDAVEDLDGYAATDVILDMMNEIVSGFQRFIDIYNLM